MRRSDEEGVFDMFQPLRFVKPACARVLFEDFQPQQIFRTGFCLANHFRKELLAVAVSRGIRQ